jgi:hypothetical protein
MTFTADTIGRMTLVAGLAMALGLVSAQAQQPTPEQTSAIRSNCRSDFMANCSGVTPGGAEALECLKRNVAKLSGGCKSAVSAIAPAPAAAPAASTATAPPPAGQPPAKPAMAPAKPAMAPAAKLAAPPAAAPPPAVATAAPAVPPLILRPMLPRRRLEIMMICHGDAERLCAGAPRIGPDALDCLAVKAGSLSPTCYEALARVSRP